MSAHLTYAAAGLLLIAAGACLGFGADRLARSRAYSAGWHAGHAAGYRARSAEIRALARQRRN